MAKVKYIILIALTVFFSVQLISIGLAAAIPVLLGIDLLVILLTAKKKDAVPAINTAGKWAREKIEILGAAGEEASAALGKFAIKTAKVIGKGTEAAYNEIGGTEGMKKAADKITKAAGECIKVVGYAAVKTVETAANAIGDISKQIEKDKAEKERYNLLKDMSEYADYEVMDDD